MRFLSEALRRLRRGGHSPDPKWSVDPVSETSRDPRTEALARRLDAAPRLAEAPFEYVAVDPDTGRPWLVDAGGRVQGGSWRLEMRPLPDDELARRLRPTPASVPSPPRRGEDR